jgi:hypothetical protein
MMLIKLKETPMKSPSNLALLYSAIVMITTASCQQEEHAKNARKQAPTTKSVIARISADPQKTGMGVLKFTASDALINKTSNPFEVAKAYDNGRPLTLKKDGMALAASDTTGNMFALYQCPPGYYIPSSVQASQAAPTQPQPNIGIDNIYSTFSNGGSSIFSNLLGGSLASGDGITESISGTLQSLIGIFTGSNAASTLALPSGQTASNYAAYGCVPINSAANANYYYPTNTVNGQTSTGTPTAPTQYQYIGQVQAGPYTYHTYAVPAQNAVQPAPQTTGTTN